MLLPSASPPELLFSSRFDSHFSRLPRPMGGRSLLVLSVAAPPPPGVTCRWATALTSPQTAGSLFRKTYPDTQDRALTGRQSART